MAEDNIGSGASDVAGSDAVNRPAGLPAEASAKAGGSNTAPAKIVPPVQPAAPESEAHIIEETVVKPAAALKSSESVSPPAPPPLPPPSPPPPPARKPTPAPLPAPPPPQPPPSPQPPAPPATSVPPATHTPAEFAKEQEAIANILKEIKLPERRTPEAPKETKVFDTTLGATPPPAVQPATTPQPVKSTPPAQANEPAKQSEGLASSIVAPLRTLKNDLQKIIRVNKISLVRAAALESQKHRTPAEEERQLVSEGRSRRGFGILFAAALFVVLGAAAFLGVFLIMGERSGIPSENPQSSILFAENGVPFPLDNNSSIELKRLLAQARLGSGGTLGSITRIIPVVSETSSEGVISERPATLEEFLRALGVRAPEELFRALPDDFFFGIHTVDENAPLFVIPVPSYERAFAGMLRWEETLNADLSPAFTPIPDQTIGSGGLPEKRRFEDVVMRNYDVRVLKNEAGGIELYYSFPTRELLIIAESPYSFTEVLSRLRAERKL